MKPILAGLGAVLIILGIIVAVLTPIPGVPIGAPISIAGLALLVRNSERGRAGAMRQLEKHPKLARFVPDKLRDFIFGAPPL